MEKRNGINGEMCMEREAPIWCPAGGRMLRFFVLPHRGASPADEWRMEGFLAGEGRRKCGILMAMPEAAVDEDDVRKCPVVAFGYAGQAE